MTDPRSQMLMATPTTNAALETKTMVELRSALSFLGHTDKEIDAFKSCIGSLEMNGYGLFKKHS